MLSQRKLSHEGYSFSGNLQIFSVKRSISLRRARPPFLLKHLHGQYALGTGGFPSPPLLRIQFLASPPEAPDVPVPWEGCSLGCGLLLPGGGYQLREVLGVGAHTAPLCGVLCVKMPSGFGELLVLCLLEVLNRLRDWWCRCVCMCIWNQCGVLGWIAIEEHHPLPAKREPLGIADLWPCFPRTAQLRLQSELNPSALALRPSPATSPVWEQRCGSFIKLLIC